MQKRRQSLQTVCCRLLQAANRYMERRRRGEMVIWSFKGNTRGRRRWIIPGGVAPGGICQKEMAASLFLEIQVCIEYLGTRH